MLAEQRGAVESNLAQATGLDQGAAGSLMELVAPLVMAAVGRSQQQSGLDSSDLAQFPGEQQQQQAAAPGMMGMLSSLTRLKPGWQRVGRSDTPCRKFSLVGKDTSSTNNS